MNIADRIQYLRKQKGYSQEELADKVGVSRQAVSKWESEQSTPDLEKVIAMSELFEVTTDYILKGIEPVSTTNRKTVKTLYWGFVLIFATIAGIWSFAANRFNYDEIISKNCRKICKSYKYSMCSFMVGTSTKDASIINKKRLILEEKMFLNIKINSKKRTSI